VWTLSTAGSIDDDQAPRHLVPLVAKEEENGMHDHFEFSIEQLGTIVFLAWALSDLYHRQKKKERRVAKPRGMCVHSFTRIEPMCRARTQLRMYGNRIGRWRRREQKHQWIRVRRPRLRTAKGLKPNTPTPVCSGGAGVLKPPYHFGFHGRPFTNFVKEKEGRRKF